MQIQAPITFKTPIQQPAAYTVPQDPVPPDPGEDKPLPPPSSSSLPPDLIELGGVEVIANPAPVAETFGVGNSVDVIA